MAPTLRNSPKSYRSCILYEVQLGRSIVEAYKNFCRNTKNDRFDCVKFVYWFNRFANGKIDFEDEGLDIKPKSFSDLPMEILGEIVGKLDLVNKLRTRKVSRFLRCAVDKQNAHYEQLFIGIKNSQISISFEKQWVIYKNSENGCLIEYVSNGFQSFVRPPRVTFVNSNFLDVALNDLAIALKKPKLELEWLNISFGKNADQQTEQFLKFFGSLKCPIRAKMLQIGEGRAEYALSILSMLLPGTLNEIRLDNVNTGMIANEIVKLDQWKQAKIFKINQLMTVGIEEFLHFNCFTIFVESISANDVIRLRDGLSKSANFHYCCLKFAFYPSSWDYSRLVAKVRRIEAEIGRALGAGISQESPHLPIRHRHRIPGSNLSLYFKTDIRGFYISRKH